MRFPSPQRAMAPAREPSRPGATRDGEMAWGWPASTRLSGQKPFPLPQKSLSPSNPSPYPSSRPGPLSQSSSSEFPRLLRLWPSPSQGWRTPSSNRWSRSRLSWPSRPPLTSWSESERRASGPVEAEARLAPPPAPRTSERKAVPAASLPLPLGEAEARSHRSTHPVTIATAG